MLAQTATDTINDFFQVNGATLIESPNGGYVSGTNGYKDSEKLQAFFPYKSYSILGAFVWTGKKVFNSANSNSRICLKVKNFDTTTVSTFPFMKGIGSTIDSAWYALSESNPVLSFDAGLKYYPFSSPILINSFYALGISFDSLAQDSEGNLLDSIAIFSSAMDSVSFPNMSWEKWNGNYKRIADTWGFDIDLALFPVIDSTLNFNEKIMSQEIAVYPNPANQTLSFSIPSNQKNLVLSVYSMDGKLVINKNCFDLLSTQTIDTTPFTNGIYFLRIQNEHWIGLAPFTISH